MKHTIECGDTLNLIQQIPLGSIDLIVTTPPAWGKYTEGNREGLGAEGTLEAYIEHLADFFCALQPYLKPTANVFVNVVDTYFTHITPVLRDPAHPRRRIDGRLYQDKQLLLLPFRFAAEMQDRGWLLRNDIIWYRPNWWPLCTKDRLSNTYEHVLHLTPQKKYYYDVDAIKVRGVISDRVTAGDVWAINTQRVVGRRTLAFPEKLVERIVLCGSPIDGYVLDPFLGTGTTWIVSERLGRNCIGFEIDKPTFNFAKERYAENIEGKAWVTPLS